MAGVPVLDDFFTFLDENGSFSLNFSEIGLKLTDGYEKIAAYFSSVPNLSSSIRDDGSASKHFLISTWASSALE